MDAYLGGHLFGTLRNSFVYVERHVTAGVRRGLVGMLDLEAYNYAPGATAPVRASEGTIVSRLPARIDVRRRALLELPHIMALIDDRDCRVIEPLSLRKDGLEQVYGFELMEDGGAVEGWRLPGGDAEDVLAALAGLAGSDGLQIVIGDGNHSLAAAKSFWDELKTGLSPSERDTHPARFALMELNNVYDPAVRFEAIHRVVFRTDPGALLAEAARVLPTGKNGYELRCVSASGGGALTVEAGSIGEFIGLVQAFLDDAVNRTGCTIDYIHGDEAAEKLGRGDGCAAFLMPAMDKTEFFRTVRSGALFPRKSFSIGHAGDKRYYLECRAIRPNT